MFKKVFGAFCSDPFRVSKYFYDAGETFLFSFGPDFQVGGFGGVLFSETSLNVALVMIKVHTKHKYMRLILLIGLTHRFFYRCKPKVEEGHNKNSSKLKMLISFICVFFSNTGGAERTPTLGGFALWLDADLYRGGSISCPTVHNAPLSTHEDFTVLDVEVWTVHS
ncbi:nuclear receptor coactivator 7-like [Poecilia latipinna]|uniref:nuclear receptor coactivator 7-like n=1 Tax=Poecilia latipinna TaxID=48699 RepID=UPI00072E8D4D|nr:PREDICTED: nuclear receptor coactivator 7-like [Poecilia latipinna]